MINSHDEAKVYIGHLYLQALIKIKSLEEEIERAKIRKEKRNLKLKLFKFKKIND